MVGKCCRTSSPPARSHLGVASEPGRALLADSEQGRR
jgi:hypothetical protein